MDNKIIVDKDETLNQTESNINGNMDIKHHYNQGRKKISIESIANIPLSRDGNGSHLQKSPPHQVVETIDDTKLIDHDLSNQGSESNISGKRARRSLPLSQSHDNDDGERPLRSKVKQITKSKDVESKMSDGEDVNDIESKVDAKSASLPKAIKRNGASKLSSVSSQKKSNEQSKNEILDTSSGSNKDAVGSATKKGEDIPVVEVHSSTSAKSSSHRDIDQSGEKKGKQKKAITSSPSATVTVTEASGESETKTLAMDIEKKKKSISAITSKIQQRTPTKSPASLIRVVSPITAMEAVSILKALSGRPAIEEGDDDIVKLAVAPSSTTTVVSNGEQSTPSKAMSDAISALQEAVGSPLPPTTEMEMSSTAVVASTANGLNKIDELSDSTENRNEQGETDISKKRERTTESSESVQDSHSIQSLASSSAVNNEFDHSNKKQKTAKGRVSTSSKSGKVIEIERQITTLKVGTRVYCNWMNSGSWFAGEISKVHTDKGTYDIDYDDGDVEYDVPNERFRKEEIKFRLGQEIKGNWQNQGIYYCGRIVKIHNNNVTKFDLKYEDGDEETDVPRRNIKLVGYKVNDKVIVNYLGKGGWFQGVVKKVNGCLYDVHFVDGDNEINVLPHNIVMNLIELPIKSRVIANWKGNGAYLPGSVIKKELDRKYTVEYDDGEIENGVQRKWMRNEAYLSLHKGQKVLVNHKNSGVFFPGKVHQIHKVAGEDPSEKVYDIHYDDGDSETKVTVDRINPVEEPQPLHVGQRVAGK